MSEGLPILQEQIVRSISRRELGRGLLRGLAAGVLPAVLSPLHPVYKHLSNDVLLDSFDAALATSNYKAVFLTASQLAELDKLCEALIPGSRKAKSAEFIDLLLSVDANEPRKKFSDSLAAMEAAAKSGFQKNVASLNPEEIDRLLEKVATKDSADHEHFENLKSWAIGAYYSSEIGMRELGWQPDRVFPTFPACPHEESHS